MICATPTFVEFGFHPVEFNCVALAEDPAWQGLLIDGNKQIVDDARTLWPDRIRMVNAFLSLDNLDLIRNQFKTIGLLSIDVDGNDYWFLKALIDLKPDAVVPGLGVLPVPIERGVINNSDRAQVEARIIFNADHAPFVSRAMIALSSDSAAPGNTAGA